jgi:phytoene synthase
MNAHLDELGSLARYTVASEHAADQIIRAYSTSFGTATRLLGRRHRAHVRNIYALARVADELVDGATDEAGITPEQQHRALDRLENETARAIDTGYSSNPIVHAFASTARASGIGTELTTPFFRSMRTDITASTDAHQNLFGANEHADYVYGSAEVIGLMCLRVFMRDDQPDDELLGRLETGAKSLGAAFQNVNFLRDLADDTHRLGRSYLSDQGQIDAAEHAQWIATIREQLRLAAETLPLLPRDARFAVACALSLFARLTDRLSKVSAAELYQRRVRVPAPEKAWLILRQSIAMRKESRA